jgi:hypothetical protein
LKYGSVKSTDLLALVGDRHRADDGVELAIGQRHEDAVPLGVDEFILETAGFRQRRHQVDIETDDVVVFVHILEGAIFGVGAHFDGQRGRSAAVCGGRRRGCGRRTACQHQDEDSHHCHDLSDSGRSLHGQILL